MSDLVPRRDGLVVDEAWATAIAPTRREVSRTYLEKAKRAIDAGLFDAAVNYVWDLVVSDLRQKVEAYGVDIFLSVEDGIKYHESGDTLQDRWRDVADYRLLSGCLKLSLISRTAFRHLSFWLSVRNHESAAHPVDEEEELDLRTTLSLVGDAVRFVLARERPAPGFNLRAMAESIKTKDLSGDLDELLVQLRGLNPSQSDSALGMMVTLFVGGSTQAKANVGRLLMAVWEQATEDAKRRVGDKYAKLSAEGASEEKAEVFSLLSMTGGVGYIPEGLRRAMFSRASRDLLDAHFGWDNFQGEIAPARQLAELGPECPDAVLPQFCRAWLVSYMGNYYGESRGAQPYLSKLRDRFTNRHWCGLVEAIRSTSEVHSEMGGDKPFRRLQALCQQMLPALVSARDKRDCEFIISQSRRDVLARFVRDDAE